MNKTELEKKNQNKAENDKSQDKLDAMIKKKEGEKEIEK